MDRALVCFFRDLNTSSYFKANSFTVGLRRLTLSSADMNFSREVKFFNKLVNTAPKKKRRLVFEELSQTKTNKGPKFDQGLGGSKENSRRIAVLNSLFMKHVSDLLMTGSASEHVLDKNLEISRVAIAPNFKILNVFWATNSEANASALEVVLPQVGYTLRHELSQLRVMGVVPHIAFVKDRHQNTAMKVDHILSFADFGEDHTPLPLGSEFKNVLPSEIPNWLAVQSKNVKKENDCAGLKDSKEEEEAIQVDSMPVMRQDIFNLDHQRIMNKIMKNLSKSRALHRFQPNLEIDSEGVQLDPTAERPEENISKQEREEAMAKFIKDRKILRQQLFSDKYNSHLKPPVPSVFEDEEDSDHEEFMPQDYFDDDDHHLEVKEN